MWKNDVRKILIVQTAFVGDVILVTPLIRGVRQLFPNSVVDVLVIPQTAGILKNNPDVRDIIVFDKRNRKYGSFREVLSRLRDEQYDLAVSPHGSATTALLLFRAGIPRRIGFARGVSAWMFTDRIPVLKNTHTVQKNLHLLKYWSHQDFDRSTRLFPGDEDYLIAQRLMSKLIEPRHPVVALAPGSVWWTKRWPGEYYTELASHLTHAGVRLVFIGSPDERELCDHIIAGSGAKMVVNTAGEADILTSAALLSMCDLIVCNDSGAMHIANAMKTDVIAMFGPTIRGFGFYPFRDSDIVFEVEMPCRPCSSHGPQKCPLGHHKCMRSIKPGTVFRVIQERLRRLTVSEAAETAL